jgi:hypothetical protein
MGNAISSRGRIRGTLAGSVAVFVIRRTAAETKQPAPQKCGVFHSVR